MHTRAWKSAPANYLRRKPPVAEEEIHPGIMVLSRFTAGAFGSLSGHYAGLCPPRCGHTLDRYVDVREEPRHQH